MHLCRLLFLPQSNQDPSSWNLLLLQQWAHIGAYWLCEYTLTLIEICKPPNCKLFSSFHTSFQPNSNTVISFTEKVQRVKSREDFSESRWNLKGKSQLTNNAVLLCPMGVKLWTSWQQPWKRGARQAATSRHPEYTWRGSYLQPLYDIKHPS